VCYGKYQGYCRKTINGCHTTSYRFCFYLVDLYLVDLYLVDLYLVSLYIAEQTRYNFVTSIPVINQNAFISR
jgi:hypothetical protein